MQIIEATVESQHVSFKAGRKGSYYLEGQEGRWAVSQPLRGLCHRPPLPHHPAQFLPYPGTLLLAHPISISDSLVIFPSGHAALDRMLAEAGGEQPQTGSQDSSPTCIEMAAVPPQGLSVSYLLGLGQPWAYKAHRHRNPSRHQLCET